MSDLFQDQPNPELQVTSCYRCGEDFKEGDHKAEVSRVDLTGDWPEGNSVIVHAEPCAMEMLKDGWGIS
jgi:hypothetical protein